MDFTNPYNIPKNWVILYANTSVKRFASKRPKKNVGAMFGGKP